MSAWQITGVVAGAVLLMLVVVVALLRRAEQIDADHPDGLGSLDLRERQALRGGPCRCGKCGIGDDLDVAEAAGVTPTVVAGSDLDRTQRPIAEVNKRFESIAKSPELRDLNATQLEKLYLVPGEEFAGLINRDRKRAA